jgi:hypothetical protein
MILSSKFMITIKSFLKERAKGAFEQVVASMTDVDDKMLHWEPAPGSWGLRQKDGYWVPDYDQPKPKPPGPKTIGWLIAHLATCKQMYYEYAFGEAKLQWDDIVIPGDTQGLRDYLNNWQTRLVGRLDNLSEADFEQNVLTNWGEKKPIWWIYWIMIYHDIEHGGQIFQLKREYQNLNK